MTKNITFIPNLYVEYQDDDGSTIINHCAGISWDEEKEIFRIYDIDWSSKEVFPIDEMSNVNWASICDKKPREKLSKQDIDEYAKAFLGGNK